MSLLRSLSNHCVSRSINITLLWRSRVREFASSIRTQGAPNAAASTRCIPIPKRLYRFGSYAITLIVEFEMEVEQ
jgi:hypothetical protein